MKKKLVASLAAVMVLGIAGTSFAATNPFVDVPAKHWAYESVTKLAQAGIVDGYGDGTFRGDKVMSRYEMAQIVAKAMAHADRANAEQKAAIEKLATEFATELEGLNVRVTNVENKVDNVKWGGEFRERFDSVKQEGASRSTGNSHSYVDMWATAQINPDWVGKVEYESTKNMTNAGTTSTASSVAGAVNGAQVSSTRVYVQGNLFGGQATIGKFNPFTAYGLVVDDSMTGVTLQYGNTLKARIGVGNYSGGVSSFLGNSAANLAINGLPITPGLNIPSGNGAPSYAFGELDLAASKVTNVKVVYHELGNLNGDTFITNTNSVNPFMFGNTTQTSIRYTEAGFDTKLAADWALMGTYSKSNLDVAGQDNKGYLAQITYKAADTKKAGSYDIYTNYRRIPVAAQLDSTWDYAKGIKGWQVGFDYIPATNIKVNVFYLDGKNIIDENTETNAKIYRAQAELFF